ncbi:MAG: cytochrome c/FTR1 family iron permease [Gemmatimonadota bacterium]|nr:cytochrome c/FTR1 family iron permease [Gemmatimonadota bacterium]
MRFRSSFLAVVMALGLAAPLVAQEPPARRMANIVSVAVEEYGKGVDASGRLTAASEYQEAMGFLADARAIADRLTGAHADSARGLLDSIIAAARDRRAPAALASLQRRFAAALGSEGALEMPTASIDLAAGKAIYERTCAACHGPSGHGDGPQAAMLNPRPAPIGDPKVVASVTPEIMFRIASVGVSNTPMVGFAGTLTPQQRWNVVSYVVSLRATAAQVADGEGLYFAHCAQCHGATGGGDGPYARNLSKLPPEIGTFAWQVSRTDDSLARAVREGVPGTAMPPAGGLGDAQVRSMVAYLRTLPMKNAAATVAAAPDTGAAGAAGNVTALLEQALASAQLGRPTDAGDRAFDAYLAFEPLEGPARAKNPGLVARMEKLFGDFKAAVRADDVPGAQHARDVIEANLPAIVELTRPAGSAAEAFWQSFLIILREGFEAILVIGAVVAFLLKTGHRERLRSIWLGVGLGLAASAVTAVALRTILAAVPASSEIIEGVTLLVAVAVLFSVSYWLISRVEAAKWQQFIRDKVTDALQRGGGRALAFVAFLAVFREGAETALFYQALFSEGPHLAVPLSLGIAVGFVALAVIFTLFYRYGVRIPLRPFFSVTSVLLYYMAFVFTGKGIRELQEGNAVSMSVIHGFPHVEALGIYPTWETVLAQLLLLVLFVFALAKTFWPRRSVALPTIPDTPADSALDRLRAEHQELSSRLAALEERLGGRRGAGD